MRGGDGRGDGQPEAVPIAPACAARPEPLEGLEQAVDLGGRDDLTGVGHRHDGAGVAMPLAVRSNLFPPAHTTQSLAVNFSGGKW